ALGGAALVDVDVGGGCRDHSAPARQHRLQGGDVRAGAVEHRERLHALAEVLREDLLQPLGVLILAVGDLVTVVGGGDGREHLGVDAGVVIGCEAAHGGVMQSAHFTTLRLSIHHEFSAALSDVAGAAYPLHMRTFLQVLANTMVANVTTSFLWFALTFWVYLETKNVMATGIIGGAYMLLIAVFSILFGTLVDRHRKRAVLVFSSAVTAVAFLASWLLFLSQPEQALLDFGGPWFWLFAGIILLGAVVEQMRNIALSTTVTLLVPVERHANANGMVGTVQGLAFLVTS